VAHARVPVPVPHPAGLGCGMHWQASSHSLALYAEHPALGRNAPDLSTAHVICVMSGLTREHSCAAPFELRLSVRRCIPCGGGAIGLKIRVGCHRVRVGCRRVRIIINAADTHAHSKVLAVLGAAGMPWPCV